MGTKYLGTIEDKGLKDFGILKTEGDADIVGCSAYENGMCKDEPGKYCDGCSSFRPNKP